MNVLQTQQLVIALASATLLSGCYTYAAAITLRGSDTTRAFTLQDEDKARKIAIEIGQSAGLWQTDLAIKLSDSQSSWPYHWFVSLGAPGSKSSERSVSILGEMRKDRREIRVTVDDIERGDPLPSTVQLIEELRIALEQAFPDRLVEVTSRKKLHLLAP